MERPDYDKILKDKIEHYGETKAAYQFAAEELARKEVEFALLDVSNNRAGEPHKHKWIIESSTMGISRRCKCGEQG